ncbi:MAG: hypothetical protein ACTSQO_13620 [Candidatus Helarchaeota archaeon]
MKIGTIFSKLLAGFSIFSIIVNIGIIPINMIGIFGLGAFYWLLNNYYIIWGVCIILNISLNFLLCDITNATGKKIVYWCISLCIYIVIIIWLDIGYFILYNGAITQTIALIFMKFLLLISNFGLVGFNVIISLMDIINSKKSIWRNRGGVLK